MGSSQATAHVYIQLPEPSGARNLTKGDRQAHSSDDDSDDGGDLQLLAAIADSLMADINPLANAEQSSSSDSEDDASQHHEESATPPDDSFETLGNDNHLPSESENEDMDSSMSWRILYTIYSRLVPGNLFSDVRLDRFLFPFQTLHEVRSAGQIRRQADIKTARL